MQTPRPDPDRLSEDRVALVWVGRVVAGVGLLVFVSNVFIQPDMNPMHPTDFSGMAGRGLGGMALLVVGALLSNAGKLGMRGSGIIPDPAGMREDLQPWQRAAGKMEEDRLSQVDTIQRQTAALEHLADGKASVAEIRVRCQKCRALNDESAKFCNQCGGSL